jgi:tRNA guanosine-2'-O-methyltransferase
MDTDAILNLLDERSRIQAFKHHLLKLETAPRLDLDALTVCIKLRPPLRPRFGEDHSGSHASSGSPLMVPSLAKSQPNASEQAIEECALAEKLCDILLLRIPNEHLVPDHIYSLAKIICSDGPLANVLFREKIHGDLVALLPELSKYTHRDNEASNEAEGPMKQNVRIATAYLTCLKCTYWLPSNYSHVVVLTRFIGLPALDDVAHDTISACLSLLKRGEPIVVAPPTDTSQSWLETGTHPGSLVLASSIVDGSLWDRLSMLEPNYFTSGEFSMP